MWKLEHVGGAILSADGGSGWDAHIAIVSLLTS